MFSSGAKNSIASLALAVMAVIFACAFEEMVPKAFGVGLPLLLMAAVLESSRGLTFGTALFVVACGAAEDAISHLPAMTSISYFVLAALLTRRSKAPLAVFALAYPAYQLWLWVWMSGLGGAVFTRMLVAFPLGVAAAAAVSAAGGFLHREASVG